MLDTSEKTKKEINDKFTTIFNNFYEESIGNSKVNVMPTYDKIPEIKKIGYNKQNDTFEVIFSEYNSSNSEEVKDDNVTFIENQEGHLMAIIIHQFSKIKTIIIEITTSIKNEIEKVSMQLKTKDTNIPDSIVDKRKLMFMDEILKMDSSTLKKLKSQQITNQLINNIVGA